MGHATREKDDPSFNEGHFMEAATVMRLAGEDIVDVSRIFPLSFPPPLSDPTPFCLPRHRACDQRG